MANVPAKTAVMTASAYLVADRASAARNAEVTICEVTGAYITQYAFFADQQSALKRALTAHMKLKLPAPSCFETVAPKQIAMRIEPSKIWIVSAKKPASRPAIFDKFYPLEITGSRAILKIRGGKAIEVLRRLSAANLDCEAGSLMATGMHHIPVHLLKQADDEFLLFIPRSYAESLGHLIVQIARQYRSAVTPAEKY